ncbi:substrate-binding domain-containing protein [Pseudoduganella sp. FT93W]|uniref:Substrate-binding domain-containing protein n=2 Tax=Duganella fentianensis TaxID=2692177 RepID=A0A845I563_9BURK|nr:substrate-binding domain-containing protein [Duganella fentianensis]
MVVALAAALSAPVMAQDKPRVGLVMKSLSNEFFKNMADTAQAYRARRGDFDLKAVGMKDETDVDSQVVAVESMIIQKASLIVLAPADSRAMVAPVAKAVKAGIMVVNIDVALDEAAKKKAGLELAFIGPDNRAGAKLAGEALGKALKPGDKVVIIEGNPGADNGRQRKAGFMDAVQQYQLNLVASRSAMWGTDEANQIFSNILTAHPDVKGVMAANDSMAVGIVKAIDAAGKSGKIKVVGFDNIPAVRPLIKSGKMLATVDQFGADMAANAIDLGLKARKSGVALTGWVKTPVALITAAELK